ncbi:disease resistance protein RPV1-like isoform X2 [Hibiscus syriacus]|uniref:disease resistance protein RPV1-like isoform X2 n=1 Tax=Hibiscus syriacus TaxID=106335 RepID=UPI0019231205|nr:disease resistance protein RPV1-like isoform X2 [Hibiscus syriacus]
MFSSKSSASSSMVKPATYDVFLSFRGEDTRHGFVSHLRKELCRKKIETFIDDEKLPRGDEISEVLLLSIEESRGSLVVFSRDYASSKWCLAELAKIMHCKKRNPQRYFVVPVFYGVDPSDVRKQTGSFSDAFAKHEDDLKHDVIKLKTWRTGLTDAANLSGWDSQVTRPESTLVDEIVEDILKKLSRGTSSASLEGLVGIERRMEQVMSLLQTEKPDLRKLGIWGMGGIGKTTLADAIFNHVSNGFESSFFLRNVRESEERGTLVELREKFLSAILEDGNLNISAPTIGSGFVKDMLSRKMVLVVCDDVSNSSQLEFLFREINQLGPGSRVIVTTRDKQVLIQNDIDLIYEVKELDGNESIELFCQCAFKSKHPKEHQLELSKMVLSFANGNPLAIKVMGSSLYGRSQSYQESAVKKLKQVPNPTIHKLLRSSFDGLDWEERDIFLDIACFYKGEDLDFVMRILDASYVSALSGIDNLIDKSLISVSENTITMHDLLQQMGWDIVRNESPSEPARRSRLWIPNDIRNVLIGSTGTETLKGMLLDISRISELELKPDAFVKMPNLKLLKFYDSDRYNCFQNKSKILLRQRLSSLPEELRYLCWEGYPLKTLPNRFYPSNLVVLDMRRSHVEQLWQGKQDLVNLKKITLFGSKKLVRISDLSSATNLEEIDLSYCTNLLELPSLYKATFLTQLDLSGCSKLSRFPEVSPNVAGLYLGGTQIEGVPSSMGFLSQLVSLSMNECARLKNFPTDICNLISLQFLSLGGVPNITTFPVVSLNILELNLRGTAIEEVPSWIECLSNLREMKLWGCRRLKSVSTSIHKLKSLEYLDLACCSRLETFPEILDTMERLRVLDLRETALKELPSSMENLIGLSELSLNNCENLVCLPDSLYKLKSLQGLHLGGCSRLENFPEILDTMESLITLDLSGTALKKLPSSMENLTGLQHFRMNNCENLVCLPHSFYKLKSLEDFFLGGCSRLEIFPEILDTMERLITLDLSGTALKKLPSSMENLIGLTDLRLNNCENLVYLPDNLFSSIEGACFLPLAILNLSETNMENLPTTIKQLPGLWKLILRKCKRLKSLPELPPSLVHLEAHDCNSLEDASSIKKHFEKVLENDNRQASSFTTCISGSEIPEWFDFESSGSSINIRLPSEWYDDSRINFAGFAVAAAVSFQYCSENVWFRIRCACHLKSINGDCDELPSFFSIWMRHQPHQDRLDHLFLWYDDDEDQVRQFAETRASNELIYNEASFKFDVVLNREYKQEPFCWEVKHCGVYQLFAEDEALVHPSKRVKRT